MKKNKEKIITILKATERKGIDNLIKWLEESDFFTAPASTDFHGNENGGLAAHSLSVYELLAEKVKRYQTMILDDSVAICGLMHDICKTNFYKRDIKSIIDPDNPKVMKSYPEEKDPISGKVLKWGEREVKNWIDKEVWVVDDQFPAGHGEKSVFLLQEHIKLTKEEMLAIRWHMIAFDAGIHFNYPSGFPFRKAVDEYPLVTLLFTADFESSSILEKVNEDNRKINKI